MFRSRLQLVVIGYLVGAFVLLASARAQQTGPGKVLIARAGTAQDWAAQWEPTRLVNGSPVIFRVTPPRALKNMQELKGSFLRQELSFRYSEACHCWYA